MLDKEPLTGEEAEALMGCLFLAGLVVIGITLIAYAVRYAN